MNGMTHYYNLVLSKLNKSPGIELTLIAPLHTSSFIGTGVLQTEKGVNFKTYKLKEVTLFKIFTTFKGLVATIAKERPHIIVVIENYLFTFLFHIPVIILIKTLKIKIILKSIPFRIPFYEEAKMSIEKRENGARLLQKKSINEIINKIVPYGMARRLYLELRKISYRIPDGHVNYIDDAFVIFGSYGVRREKIFITRNSPDTDLLFQVKKEIEKLPPILPIIPLRVVHIGRLIPWKRVDILLKVIARLRQKVPNVEVLIIGDGPELANLKTIAHDLGLKSHAKFLGPIHEPVLLGRYLLSSTVYVLSGMGGLSINDAMCFGLPVICSVGDGTEKILVRQGVNGLYFKDGDEDDLFQKVLFIANNPEKAKIMGKNSTSIIEKEVNIHTVIKGYKEAFEFVTKNTANIWY
jgi:glycosyltransferase involved in cell wall biosynthesis